MNFGKEVLLVNYFNPKYLGYYCTGHKVQTL